MKDRSDCASPPLCCISRLELSQQLAASAGFFMDYFIMDYFRMKLYSLNEKVKCWSKLTTSSKDTVRSDKAEKISHVRGALQVETLEPGGGGGENWNIPGTFGWMGGREGAPSPQRLFIQRRAVIVPVHTQFLPPSLSSLSSLHRERWIKLDGCTTVDGARTIARRREKHQADVHCVKAGKLFWRGKLSGTF